MKKKKISENYLEKIPALKSDIKSEFDDAGIATLKIENRGVMNFIAQKLFFKPRYSYIHLDTFGSFVLSQTNGIDDIAEIGKRVEERFAQEAHPLYERLAKFFQIMDSYNFLEWK